MTIAAVWQIIVVLWVIFAVLLRVKKQKSKDTTNSKAFKQTRQKYNNFPTGAELQARKQRIPSYHTSKFDNHLLEDREHDWLSEQLAYEQNIQTVVSDMFQLRRSHFDECNAEQARQSTQKMSQTEMDELKDKIRNRSIMS